MLRNVLFSLFLLNTVSLQAQTTQNLRGVVTDDATNKPLPFASVILEGTLITTLTDSLGQFSLKKTPIGRCDIKVSCTGYASRILTGILINSAKETYLEVTLMQKVTELSEVVIKRPIETQLTPPTMASVSTSMLTVEEASRYAGGFDDPARLASSFAGVASNTDENGIIVRGNAPGYLQWRLEEIEIPNPSHFADMRMFGGGTLTALSSQILGNSDFYTGAFSAEYSNALSGVFDLKMRSGNNQKHEKTIQAGIVGLDFSGEGPFSKSGNSSYLFNYRYATLALLASVLPDNAAGMRYQDLAFKLNLHTKKAGTFSIWAMGLTDRAEAKAKTDSSLWIYANNKQHDEMKLYSGVGGISHQALLRGSTSLKTTLATTIHSTYWATRQLDRDLQLHPESRIKNKQYQFTLSSYVNFKPASNHTNKTGIRLTGIFYQMQAGKVTESGFLPSRMIDSHGFGSLLSAYSSSSIRITEKTVVNAGITGQLFTLNGRFSIEPRASIKTQLDDRQYIAVAYGLHSRLEKLSFYLNNDLKTGYIAVNKDLNFSKAHHFVLSYSRNLNPVTQVRLEPYFQHLFSIPVVAGSSFSMINLQREWFFAEKLQNSGRGENYGIDLTVERKISRGYYYLLTASLFNSSYQGGDGIWRNTRFNRRYVFNFLTGKEWQTGQHRQNLVGLNIRLSYQGGNRHSPADLKASFLAKEVVYDETKAFTMQAPARLNIHFSGSYRINRQNMTHEIALKVLNLTSQPDFYGHRYNLVKQTVDPDLASVLIPNLSYRIDF